MKRMTGWLLTLLLLVGAAAAQPVDEPASTLDDYLEAVGRPSRPKEPDFGRRLEERIAVAEESEEMGTGHRIELATEEVGRALGPVGEILNWFSTLPGYWEALLVGGVVFLALTLLYYLLLLLIRWLKRRGGVPEWNLARRFSLFIRTLIFSISLLIALVWVGETDGWLFRAASAVTSLAAAFLAINAFSYLVMERGRKKKHRKPVPVLFQQVVRAVLYIIFLLTVLGTSFEIDLSALLASSAMLSLVLGLALQDTLGNIFAGMSIHGSKPFEIGDWIKIKEYEGQVVEMNWREVRLKTFTQDNVILPNSTIADSDFINYSHPTLRRLLVVEVGTSYNDPPEKVRRVITRILEEIEGVEPAKNPVFVIDYNDFSIDYRVRFFITDFSRSNHFRNEVMNRLWYAFKRAGISIPFPIRDVYIKQRDEEAEEKARLREMEARRRLLGSIEQFSELDEATTAVLVEKLQPRLYAPGETVVLQGDPGDSVYIVAEGTFDVYIKKGPRTTLWGLKVGELKPGTLFGEMSLLTGEERTATVVCSAEGLLYTLDKNSFRELLLTNPEISRRLAELASQRVAKNLDQLSRYLSENERDTLDEQQKSAHIRKAILEQMRDFFGI